MNHLSDAKFAANNYENVSTEIISFFADYEYHSRTSIESLDIYDSTTSKKVELARADKIIERQETIRK